jgi:cellulose biosynthesis protein BcsQ
MVDGDPATSGLSLFLLGPKGMRQAADFEPQNTFVGLLQEFQRTGTIVAKPRTIHRSGSDDHGISYDTIICTNTLYGEKSLRDESAFPDLDQSSFRAGIRRLFDDLRDSGEFSYVIVDTRGGFAFESTDVCALADSFIVITEPTISSFYQDRNLVQRINQAAAQVSSPSVLRAIVINKATDLTEHNKKSYLENLEFSFRNELTKEFGIDYSVTHAIPADLDALHAYKEQKMPYISAPGSMFSYATLSAFSDIVQVVTSRWSKEEVARWNGLVDMVLTAIEVANKKAEERDREVSNRERELSELRAGGLLVERQLATLKEELEARESARSLERDLSYRKEVMQLAQRKIRLQMTTVLILVAALVLGFLFFLVRERKAKAVELSEENAKNDASLKATQESLAMLEKQLSQLKSLGAQSEASSQLSKVSPQPSVLALTGNDKAGKFGVVLSNDVDLEARGPGAPSAAFEAQLAVQNGFDGVTMYRNQGYYQTVVPFMTEKDALMALPKLRAWSSARWRTAYIRPLDSWCPRPLPNGNITPKGFTVPVFLCQEK